MWYDKERKQFHHAERDVVDVVAKLRHMADGIEQGTWGCLALDQLGDIFGNEFWNLIYDRPARIDVVVVGGEEQ